ncbi:hypothetical protein J2Y57_003566 [Sphingomonas sp. BE137]|nr:hypothetical protein [Sphingomonas sp. BE137]
MSDQTLLAEVDAFLKRTGMAESAFGRNAVNDWKLLRSMRAEKPRRLWPETEARVRQFMATYVSTPSEKAAA